MRKLGAAATLAAMLLALVAPHAFAAEPAGPDEPPEPEWARGIGRKLERKVSFEFQETPVYEAIYFLSTLTGINMIVDPRAVEAANEAGVTMGATNERAADALRRVLDAGGLDHALVRHAVFVSTPEGIAAARREEAAARLAEGRPPPTRVDPDLRAKLVRNVTFEFVDTPLSEALQFLQTLAKINILVPPRTMELNGTCPITLKVTSMPLASALGWVCRMVDSGYVPAGNAVFVVDRELLRGGPALGNALARGDFALPDGVWEVEIRRKFERKVTFEFVDTPLSEALQFLQTLTETTIIADPVAFAGKETAPITLNVTNMQLDLALRWILKLVDLDYGLVNGVVFVSTPERIAATRRAIHAKRFAEALRPEAEWRRAIRQRLERRVSFCGPEMPLTEACGFFQTLVKVTIVLDPAEDVSGIVLPFVNFNNTPLDATLRWICLMVGCDLALVDGAVFISRPERAAMELLLSAERRATDAARRDMIPGWERELRKRLSRKVTFEFAETPLGDAVQFLCSLVQAPFDVPPDARARTVTLKVQDMPLADALRWTCRLAGLDYSLADGTIPVGPSAEALLMQVAFGGQDWDIDVQDEPTFVFAALALPDVVLDDIAWERGRKRMTIRREEAPIAKVLSRALSECGLSYARIDGRVLVSSPERIVEVAFIEAARLEREAAREGPLEWWEPETRRLLDGRVDLEATEMPFGGALSVLARASDLAVAIDPEAGEDLAARPLSLHTALRGIRAGAALRWLCRLAGADYRLSEKGVLVSTPEVLRRREIDAALARMGTFEFRDVHYADIIAGVGRRAGVAARLDPGLRENYNAITFTGTDIKARAALDSLERLGGLEWAVRDGGVFVSTPAVISGKPEPAPAPARGAERRAPPPEAPASEDGPGDEDDVF